MRWKNKEKKTEDNTPVRGDQRIVRRFLWTMKLDTDNYWRWLEFAYVKEIYANVPHTTFLSEITIWGCEWIFISVLPKDFIINE